MQLNPDPDIEPDLEDESVRTGVTFIPYTCMLTSTVRNLPKLLPICTLITLIQQNHDVSNSFDIQYFQHQNIVSKEDDVHNSLNNEYA